MSIFLLLSFVTEKDLQFLHKINQSGHIMVERLYTLQQRKVRKHISNDFKKITFYSSQGHLDVCRYFVKQCKAQIDVESKQGMTPLHEAAMAGHLSVCRFLVKYLKEKRCDINKAPENLHQSTPLLMAALQGQ